MLNYLECLKTVKKSETGEKMLDTLIFIRDVV